MIRTVIFTLLVGEPITFQVSDDIANSLHWALSETWRHEAFNTINLNGTNGVVTMLNPAHIVSMEIR